MAPSCGSNTPICLLVTLTPYPPPPRGPCPACQSPRLSYSRRRTPALAQLSEALEPPFPASPRSRICWKRESAQGLSMRPAGIARALWQPPRIITRVYHTSMRMVEQGRTAARLALGEGSSRHPNSTACTSKYAYNTVRIVCVILA